MRFKHMHVQNKNKPGLKENVSINGCNVDKKRVFSTEMNKIINRTTWLIIFWKMSIVFCKITNEEQQKTVCNLICRSVL